MYIHEKQKVDYLYKFHNSQQSTLTKIKYMLSQIYKKQTSAKRFVDIGDFCTRLRKKDSIISNWTRIVHNLKISSIESLKRSLMNLIIPHKQHITLKLNLRVSMALMMRALEIRGVSVDIIDRTRQKLNTSIENSVTPFHPRVHCYVHKKRLSMLIMSPIRS